MGLKFNDYDLAPNEEILHRPHIHWTIYTPALSIIILGCLIMPWERSMELFEWISNYGLIVVWDNFGTLLSEDWLTLIGTAVIFIGMMNLGDAIYKVAIIHMSLTSHRVVKRLGIFSVETTTMDLQNIESIDIQQSFLGRLLDFGFLIFNSIGSDKIIFPLIDHPETLRRKALAAKDKHAISIARGEHAASYSASNRPPPLPPISGDPS